MLRKRLGSKSGKQKGLRVRGGAANPALNFRLNPISLGGGELTFSFSLYPGRRVGPREEG